MLQETTTARLAHHQTRLIVRLVVVQETTTALSETARETITVRSAHHQPRPTALLVIVREKVSARSEVVQVVLTARSEVVQAVLTAHSETIVDLSEEVAEMQEVVLSAAEDKNNNRYIKTKILYAKLLNKLES